jgi:hypothetical protein
MRHASEPHGHPAGDSGLVRRVKSSMCDTPRLRREVIGKARLRTPVIAGFGPEHAGGSSRIAKPSNPEASGGVFLRAMRLSGSRSRATRWSWGNGGRVTVERRYWDGFKESRRSEATRTLTSKMTS